MTDKEANFNFKTPFDVEGCDPLLLFQRHAYMKGKLPWRGRGYPICLLGCSPC